MRALKGRQSYKLYSLSELVQILYSGLDLFEAVALRCYDQRCSVSAQRRWLTIVSGWWITLNTYNGTISLITPERGAHITYRIPNRALMEEVVNRHGVSRGA